jgi:Spx/MgsR family transcriptional regulator
MVTKITFYQKPACTTCRKARGLLLKQGIEFVSRDLDQQSLTAGELDKLIGDCDYKDFLNTRNELYRKQSMKEHPPTRAEALKLMAKVPNLIRRPLLIKGSQMLIGFDEQAYRNLMKVPGFSSATLAF